MIMAWAHLTTAEPQISGRLLAAQVTRLESRISSCGERQIVMLDVTIQRREDCLLEASNAGATSSLHLTRQTAAYMLRVLNSWNPIRFPRKHLWVIVCALTTVRTIAQEYKKHKIVV